MQSLLVAILYQTGQQQQDCDNMPPLSENFANVRGPIQVYLPKDLRTALLNFSNAQRIKPSISEIGELAIQEFLQREGFWPLATPVEAEEPAEQPKSRPRGRPKRPPSM